MVKATGLKRRRSVPQKRLKPDPRARPGGVTDESQHSPGRVGHPQISSSESRALASPLTDGPRGFGNHRKYQSLDAYSDRGTGAVVESYVRWVNPPRTHAELMVEAIAATGNARAAFRALYESMDAVVGFGRMARFDYLALIGKVGLVPLEPDSTHLKGATGPVAGARRMFEKNALSIP